ncbi:unnamed protein product [Rotaria sp. Silwood2]|nr:unnamed protein product [Rotaria sp. Silwood2]CAF3222674.1 unnamed protein product [Rotaria sp. Silwood2]CAF3429153.1 unnamed protein product [Rotaria sp. Silwood2]CAF3528696.1 unnamed protein product [Rotaria sp. Silwood2]CAF4592322.1 unnamed protein product [Rotaria sp. Silwood2]
MQLYLKESVTSTNTTEQTIIAPTISPLVLFNVYLGVGILAFIFYIFIIIYVSTHKSLRSAPNNYCLLILLIVEFLTRIIGLPFDLYYYHEGVALFENATFCFIWRMINYSGYGAGVMLIAWASFERHILIFHDRFLRSKWKNICFHYVPPFIVMVYVIGFYIYVLYFLPCSKILNFEIFVCGDDCIRNYPVLIAYRRIVHQMGPPICIGIFSVSLLIRVLYSKRRLQQAFSWRKHSKMAYQLLSISFTCLSAIFPFGLLIFLNEVGVRNIPKAISDYLYFYSTLIPFYLPFVYVTSIPELWTKMKRKFRCAVIQTTPARNIAAREPQMRF